MEILSSLACSKIYRTQISDQLPGITPPSTTLGSDCNPQIVGTRYGVVVYGLIGASLESFECALSCAARYYANAGETT